jgi:hypothetical protein
MLAKSTMPSMVLLTLTTLTFCKRFSGVIFDMELKLINNTKKETSLKKEWPINYSLHSTPSGKTIIVGSDGKIYKPSQVGFLRLLKP